MICSLQWEKPEELALFEQQKPQEQQQQKPQQTSTIQQPQSQSLSQGLPNQQTQIPQLQLQSHLQTQMQAQGRHPQQLQHAPQSLVVHFHFINGVTYCYIFFILLCKRSYTRSHFFCTVVWTIFSSTFYYFIWVIW